MIEWNMATAYEIVADTVGDQPAAICGEQIRTWYEYDNRAARLASVLSDYKIGKEGKVAIMLHNSNEYLEAHHAVMKIRGCVVNVNYRYKEDELLYLLETSDAEAIIFQDTYAEVVHRIRSRLTKVKCFIQVNLFGEAVPDDQIYEYEAIIETAPAMPRISRQASDIYMLFTGGTTGMPKGAMYSNGDLCEWFATQPINGGTHAADFSEFSNGLKRLASNEEVPRGLVCSPLMHGTGMWIGAMGSHLKGGAACTVSTLGLDAHLMWQQVERFRATFMTIVGDAFARPLLKSLDERAETGKPFDLSSLERIMSSGVMFSQEVKAGLLKHLDIELVDLAGASEGTMGVSITTRKEQNETGLFKMFDNVKVLNEDGSEVEPGSGQIGRIATISPMIGYYKDEAKSKAITTIIDGERWVFTGDHATIDASGSMRFLGRGSGCINSGGEKVFPEEVEEALKAHPKIDDCLVVGIPDERFGERVVGIVSSAEDQTEEQIINFAKTVISGYKCPRHIIFTDIVQRLPNGKANYKWAKRLATESLSAA